MIFKLICLVLLTANIYACDGSGYLKIMQKYNLDIHIKSTKGWIRILENGAKMKNLQIAMEENDRAYVLKCMYELHYSDKVGVL